MDTEKFAEAQKSYLAGDYRRAARGFLESIEKGTPIGNGPAYHMAGNSFMQLKRYSDATVVFEHALRDDSYQRRGAVEANLANSYLKDGDYSAAVAHYEAALDEGNETSRYKYYQGIAQAYMRQEDFHQAALAYKHAALDAYNPQPGKALLNLGLAMMADNKPDAAVEAYRAALGSDSYDNKGRVLLNLGIAYHAQGRYKEAIRAIEESQILHGHKSSGVAERTLADARQRLALEEQVAAADASLSAEGIEAEDKSPAEILPGSVAEDPVSDSSAVPAAADTDTEGRAAGSAAVSAAGRDPAVVAGGGRTHVYADDEGAAAVIGEPEVVEHFFKRTEAEITDAARRRLRREHPFAWVKPVLIVFLILAVVFGSLAALYYTGQGWPSPKTSVTDLMEAYNAGRDVAPMWTADASDITRQMVAIPASDDFTIRKLTVGPAASQAELTVTTDDGAALDFVFDLVREGIGWKVVSVEPNY